MHRVIIVAILTIVVLTAVFSAPAPLFAGIDLAEEQNGRLVVDIRFDDGEGAATGVMNTPGFPPLRYQRFYVALPAAGSFRVTRIGGTPIARRGELPEIVASNDPQLPPPEGLMGSGPYPTAPYVVSPPFTFRKTRVIAVDCFASQVDYDAGVETSWDRYAIEVRYTPSEVTVPAREADPVLCSLVINEAFVPAPAHGRGFDIRTEMDRTRPGGAAIPDPHFALSANWVKILVRNAGVYAITGSDLAQIGVDPSSIQDPSSFRVFTGGGREKERRDAFRRPFQDEDGTWLPGNWMDECDIQVEYGGDGTFDPSDRIIFYGVGCRGWMDWYEPGAARHEYHDHMYAKDNVYYLTWDDTPGFAGSPGRMATVGAAPGPSGTDVDTFEERLYFEENRVEALTYGGDGWLWLEVLSKETPETITFPGFTAPDVVTTLPQTFRTHALAPYKQYKQNTGHHAVYIMNGETIAEKVFSTPNSAGYVNAIPVETQGMFLGTGTNVLRLHIPRDTNREDFMYFDLYEIFYQRRLRASANRLLFSSPDTTETVSYRVTNFAAGEAVYLFDVSDLFHPARLTGIAETDNGPGREIRFASAAGANRRYFWAGSSGDLLRPLEIKRYAPTDLRNVTVSPNLLIITSADFESSANRIAQHRRSNYPYEGNPVIEVVTSEEVFDNFSGGLIDPMGIRNYCKFLYDNFDDGNGFPSLTFLFLFGDANIDFKNFTTSQENLLTTNLNLHPENLDAYATDDWFVEMEQPDSTGASFIQIAVGRLPAGSDSEARFLTQRVIDYETVAEYGPWRDRVVLVADDEKSPSNNTQTIFTTQSESIAHGFMSHWLEPVKIYLTEYPAISGIKPQSRFDFLKEWNEGALVINYVGHGSSAQMADEQVFLDRDVAELRNGLRLPLFMAYSCTIGDFGRAQARSLSEKLLLHSGGGAIATITASEVSLIDPNATLNLRFFREVTEDEPSTPAPLGVALLRAKVGSLIQAGIKPIMEENSHKYNLLGDPSMRLASPRRPVRFDPVEIDAMTTGKRQTVTGEVLGADGGVDTGFSGQVHLVVREPDRRVNYSNPESTAWVSYWYAGGTVYEGTADVRNGGFEFSFKIPRFAGRGSRAFVRAYVDNGAADAVALCDTTQFLAPSPGDTTVLVPTDGPPRVVLGFKGGQTTVKPGATLQAQIGDADGINVLNTTPEGKIALVFDKADLPLDVTESFKFDHGGLDTSGVLAYPLPDLPVGGHRAILKVADSFGQVRLDTLEFSVTDPMNYAAEAVLNYPNPFTSSTYFLFNLTDRADIQLDIFTTSGKRVRRIRGTHDAGQAWILWDGRDAAGGSIANGAYLYAAKVSFVGVDRPPQTLRGKVVKIE